MEKAGLVLVFVLFGGLLAGGLTMALWVGLLPGSLIATVKCGHPF